MMKANNIHLNVEFLKQNQLCGCLKWWCKNSFSLLNWRGDYCLLFFIFLGFAQLAEIANVPNKQRLDFIGWFPNETSGVYFPDGTSSIISSQGPEFLDHRYFKKCFSPIQWEEKL